jgi:hypothetical protein
MYSNIVTDRELFIYDMSECEKRAFNLVFAKLFDEKETDEPSIFKLLSGLRVSQGSYEKVKKSVVKAWIRKWHRLGIITVLHGQIRLGSIGLAVNLLDDKSKEIVKRKIIAK